MAAAPEAIFEVELNHGVSIHRRRAMRITKMMVISDRGGRIRPNRNTHYELDISNLQDTGMISPHCSTASIHSSSNSSIRSQQNEKLSYNARLFQNLRNEGLRITPSEVCGLRREIQSEYLEEKHFERKRKCLQQAVENLAELRQELNDLIQNGSDSLIFFVFEYQTLVCWVYSTIRFSNFCSEMDRHYENMKEEHRLILSALHLNSEHYLEAALRFAHLLQEYDYFCDGEALQWCKMALEAGRGQLKSLRSTNRSQTSLNSCSSLSDSIPQLVARREEQRRWSVLEDLRVKIHDIELFLKLEGESQGEKLI